MRNKLATILSSCSSFKKILEAQALMATTGSLNHNNTLLTKLIAISSSLGYPNHAFSIFISSNPKRPTIYLYNAVIKTLALSNSAAKHAISVYNGIQFASFRPDSYSVPAVLKAVVRVLDVRVGIGVHCQAVVTGLDLYVGVATSIVQMYSFCGVIVDARKVFDEFSLSRDVEIWNSIVSGYVKAGDIENASVLFESMPERNVISWTSMISGYARMNRAPEAIKVFRKMQMEDVKFDEVAMLAGLSACADTGELKLGEWIHSYIDKHGLRKTLPLCNALIDMYAKSGKIDKALDVFEGMECKSIVTWTSMIAGLALHGLGNEAIDVFSRMERERIRPNEITFIAILSACSHAGLVEMGKLYFNDMHSRYSIKPRIEHYGCMIDLLGRAGNLQEALELLRTMPFKANGAIWGSLLAACKIKGDIELGEFALQHLMELEPSNSGSYMLLSNIYSLAGRWSEARSMRKTMKDTGVKKMRGASCIEVNGTMRDFIAGDVSHPEFSSMYDVLFTSNEHLSETVLSEGDRYGTENIYHTQDCL